MSSKRLPSIATSIATNNSSGSNSSSSSSVGSNSNSNNNNNSNSNSKSIPSPPAQLSSTRRRKYSTGGISSDRDRDRSSGSGSKIRRGSRDADKERDKEKDRSSRGRDRDKERVKSRDAKDRSDRHGKGRGTSQPRPSKNTVNVRFNTLSGRDTKRDYCYYDDDNNYYYDDDDDDDNNTRRRRHKKHHRHGHSHGYSNESNESTDADDNTSSTPSTTTNSNNSSTTSTPGRSANNNNNNNNSNSSNSNSNNNSTVGSANSNSGVGAGGNGSDKKTPGITGARTKIHIMDKKTIVEKLKKKPPGSFYLCADPIGEGALAAGGAVVTERKKAYMSFKLVNVVWHVDLQLSVKIKLCRADGRQSCSIGKSSLKHMSLISTNLIPQLQRIIREIAEDKMYMEHIIRNESDGLYSAPPVTARAGLAGSNGSNGKNGDDELLRILRTQPYVIYIRSDEGISFGVSKLNSDGLLDDVKIAVNTRTIHVECIYRGNPTTIHYNKTFKDFLKAFLASEWPKNISFIGKAIYKDAEQERSELLIYISQITCLDFTHQVNNKHTHT